MNRKKAAATAAVSVVVIALAAQLVPYGKERKNPPVAAELQWASPEAKAIARRACFDCHSHETSWPWYAGFAPVSWIIYHDISEGRRELNFSDWRGGARKHENMKDISKEVNEGEMPPPLYRLGHPEARLSPEEKNELLRGLAQVVPQERSGKHRKEEH